MPKVDLDKITLGVGPLTGKFYAGTTIKPGIWRHKKDVTSDFLGVIIQKFEGKKEIIEDDDGRWEISVKKLPKKVVKKRSLK